MAGPKELSINDTIPQSRITLTYRTKVEGKLADKELPLRLLLMGDFSQQRSKDAKLDLDQRQIRNLGGNNLDQLMKDMEMSLPLTVKDEISGDGTIQFELPITSMKSFTPAELAEKIPQIRELLRLRKLLLEVQANLDNSKKFRESVRKLSKNEELVKALGEELKKYVSAEKFQVPQLAARTPGQDTSK
jgi:type VI secretion system protein ImpB